MALGADVLLQVVKRVVFPSGDATGLLHLDEIRPDDGNLSAAGSNLP
jgi:hypothetical protein